MLSILLSEIEDRINRLSLQERLWLIEKLIQRLREDANSSATTAASDFMLQLTAMANDPEVQTEMQKIEQEFGLTGTDGLKGV
ncbi:MAG: hypothetical protein ACREOO_31085 [bacterium]